MASEYPDRFTLFAEQIARYEGWDLYGHRDAARKYLLRLLNSGHRRGHAPRNLDADWLLIAADHFPCDGIAALLQRRCAMAAVRDEIAKPSARKVRRQRRRGAA